MSKEVEIYRKHKNLKLAAAELGIAWQSLYVILRKIGEPVTGDKLKYGSDRDKLGALAESEFRRLVPLASNLNDVLHQAKYDFDVLGQKVDVKASRPHQLNKKYAALSWSFSFKKQTLICDFICCFCMREDKTIAHVLLVPSEFFKGLRTVSVSCAGASKWLDYAIAPNDLATFFTEICAK